MNIAKHPAKVSKLYIIKLSLPIFFSNLAIPMVGIVDTGLMGHLSDQKFLAAVSISTAVITMIYWSFGFLRMGTVGLVSQALGRSLKELKHFRIDVKRFARGPKTGCEEA